MTVATAHGQVLALRERVLLVETRDRAIAVESTLQRRLPSGETATGPWVAGVAASLSISTAGTMLVKKRARVGVGSEYHIVGTFSCSPTREDTVGGSSI